MVSDPSNGKEGTHQIELPIEWHVPDEIRTIHATSMVVQCDGRDFILSFFEVLPPLLLGEDIKEQAEKLTSVRATCIARVLVPGNKFAAFAQALAKSVQRVGVSVTNAEGNES
jgi:hypothetical protein